MRRFAGTLVTLAALLGLVLGAILAGSGYTLFSTIRVGDEALSTYSDELTLAWRLQEAHERKLTSGRAFLLARSDALRNDLETAAADAENALAELRQRVTSQEGIALLDKVTPTLRAHDEALRKVMAMRASSGQISHAWASQVQEKANDAREAMNAFIRHKERLHATERQRVAAARTQPPG